MSLFDPKNKRNILYLCDGEEWGFDLDRYIYHAREGRTIRIELGATKDLTVHFESEDAAKAFGKRLIKLLIP